MSEILTDPEEIKRVFLEANLKFMIRQRKADDEFWAEKMREPEPDTEMEHG